MNCRSEKKCQLHHVRGKHVTYELTMWTWEKNQVHSYHFGKAKNCIYQRFSGGTLVRSFQTPDLIPEHKVGIKAHSLKQLLQNFGRHTEQTGCDFNPSFYREGKKKPFELLRKNSKYIQALIYISSNTPENLEESYDALEEFLCHIYSYKSFYNVNLECEAALMKAYKVGSKEKVLSIVQNF